MRKTLIVCSFNTISSNGVGRTGTYIAVDRCLHQAEEKGVVNVWDTVYQMRTERINMVETLVKDLYICIVHHLFVWNKINEELSGRYSKMGHTRIVAKSYHPL